MKIHKHGKHIKTINTIIERCLIVILIVLVAIMMVLIGKLQGTARVINYTGLVRGATQREVKLEITGNPNDELINYLDGILEDLKYKDGDNDYTITIQFEDTKDYVNCALSIITCIRSEQVYITGECNVY